MSLAEHFIRRPVMTVLLNLAVVVAGALALGKIPVAALPSYNTPIIQVTATLPGASPETMANSVALPLEKQFSTIAGLSVISSTNLLGASSLTLEFDPARNIDAAAVDVQAALFRAQRSLPTEMTTPPSYRKVNPADTPILTLAVTSASLAPGRLESAFETAGAGRQLMTDGNFTGAKQFFDRGFADLKQAEQALQSFVRDNLLAGQKALAAGEKEAARKSFQLALEKSPGNEAATLGLDLLDAIHDVHRSKNQAAVRAGLAAARFTWGCGSSRFHICSGCGHRVAPPAGDSRGQAVPEEGGP